MITPAKRMRETPVYIHASLAKAVKDIEQKTGRTVLNFGPGTPDVSPSSLYKETFAKLIQERDAHLYPGYGAIPEFTSAISQWYKKRFGVSLSSDEILPLLGAKDGITALSLAFFGEGDELLIPNPGYPAFAGTAQLAGATITYYDLLEEDGFSLNTQLLEKQITGKTKAIWINFPANPTGQVVTKRKIEEIVAFAKKNNLFIFYDNAYSEITFDDFVAPSILEVEGAKDIVVEIGSFSKTFSFAGFRMGWMVGNIEAITTVHKLKSQLDSGMSLPLQKLGAFALTHPDEDWRKHMLASYKNRRDVIADHLASLGLSFTVPKAGLYIWAKIPQGEKNSEEYCQKLLEEKQILFTPGTAFGSNGERYVRVSICVNIEDIDKYFK